MSWCPDEADDQAVSFPVIQTAYLMVQRKLENHVKEVSHQVLEADQR